MREKIFWLRLIQLPAVIGLVMLSGACATTEQARTVKTTGFLSDYSKLEPDRKGQALLVYRNPEADLSAYDKVLLEEVEIWSAPDSRTHEVPDEELNRLALYLHDAIRKSLSADYLFVTQPGPGVMRIRAALTEATQAEVTMNIISTVVPLARLASISQKIDTGTEAFVGAASVEAEITDATSGTLLIAAVDRRAGGKTLKGATDPWNAVKASFDYWGKTLRDRLREQRNSVTR